jgi:hypothetical protein
MIKNFHNFNKKLFKMEKQRIRNLLHKYKKVNNSNDDIFINNILLFIFVYFNVFIILIK